MSTESTAPSHRLPNPSQQLFKLQDVDAALSDWEKLQDFFWSFYPLVMTNIAIERSSMLLIGKPSN
jgi:hypothetical protein